MILKFIHHHLCLDTGHRTTKIVQKLSTLSFTLQDFNSTNIFIKIFLHRVWILLNMIQKKFPCVFQGRPDVSLNTGDIVFSTNYKICNIKDFDVVFPNFDFATSYVSARTGMWKKRRLKAVFWKYRRYCGTFYNRSNSTK